jgi:formyl-CoA transferase
VLDLSKVLAGPLCAQYLGDLGADIIKVETIGQGDETRGWPPFPAPGLGAVFLSANRNKRSIAVDLKTEKGREIVHALAKSADIAIESFGTGVAERLGIDAATLRPLNDRLIHCSISGFGRSGPLKNSPGYDVILQAFSGIMSMTGDEGGGYVRSPISPIDQMTGVHAFSGVMALLYARERTGQGGTIQVSLFETALGLLGYNLQTYWERGVQPPKCGSSHESLCPYQAFEAADGPSWTPSSTIRNSGPMRIASNTAPRPSGMSSRRWRGTPFSTGMTRWPGSAFHVRRSIRSPSCWSTPTPGRAV